MTERLNIDIGIKRLNSELSFSLPVVPSAGIFDLTFDLTFE